MVGELSSDTVREWLSEVTDPEIPVLNIVEMGIVRVVSIEDDVVKVTLTPTYSGCPAMFAIEQNVVEHLGKRGLKHVKVETSFREVWTTDWMTAEAHRKLKEYGIAPPVRRPEEAAVPCPYCNSQSTRLTSAFGSTACKAYHYCDECQQPFEHFKCL